MAASKGKRGGSADGNTPTSDQADGSQTTRSRDNRTGAKTSGDASATRRDTNEPGRYQQRDQAGSATNASSAQSMESAFDDDDMENDAVSNYDADDADGDVDWDELPTRGGGTNPDK